MDPDKELLKKLTVASFSVGVLFILIVLVLSNAFPDPSSTTFQVNRIVLALGSAGFAAGLSGFISLTIGKPTTGFYLQAAGGLAVFAVVFFFVPGTGVIPRPVAVSHQGYLSALRLGAERDPSAPTIEFNSGGAIEVGRLWVGLVHGRSWIDLIDRLCGFNKCLTCTWRGDKSHVALTLSGKVRKVRAGSGSSEVDQCEA